MQNFIRFACVVLTVILTTCSLSYSQYFSRTSAGDLSNVSGYYNIPAWGDYDNDGDYDVVISTLNDSCSSCPTPLMFFENIGGGMFARRTDNEIAQLSIFGSGVAWGDYNNDTYADLFVCGTMNSVNYLFKNNRNGTFTRITEGIVVNDIPSWSQGCAWADYNRDGKLDLFVANRFGKNYLYKNEGDGNFSKVTEGSIVNDIGSSRGCAWGDYDNDRWQDLFVVNYDGMSDFLYRNNGNGTFTRITSGPMVTDNAWGSACSWIDVDNNGFLDLFVSNAGRNSLNALYINNGNGLFTLSNQLANTGDTYGFCWGDYDNDTRTDLFLCKRGVLNELYRNTGSTFVKVIDEVPSAEGGWSVASSFSDIDDNGRLDLFVTNRFAYLFNFYYKNISTQNNYINIKVKACGGVASAIGTRIKVIAGGTVQHKEITSSTGWNSQSPLLAHFGLGNAPLIDTVIIYWQSDSVTRHTNVQVNRTITFNECPATPNSVVGQVEEASGFDLQQNYPNPFNPSTLIRFTLNTDSKVSLGIYDSDGRLVAMPVSGFLKAGSHSVVFSGRGLPSGVYFYGIESNGIKSFRKMLLIK